MSFKQFIKQKIQSALETFFDNTGTGFQSDNVQDALTEIGASASPGTSWGSPGNNSTNTWLLNEAVPSNKVGRVIFINNPTISQIFTGSENLDTYDLSVYEHEGNEINLTLLTTVSVTASRAEFFSVNIPATQGRQLACRITSGSAKNIVAGCIVKGSV